MLVTIRQTKSSGQNLFQVEEQGQLLFQAQTPWADLRLPLEAEKMRRLTFSDAQGQPLYHTSYQLLDNILAALPNTNSFWAPRPKWRNTRSWTKPASSRVLSIPRSTAYSPPS